MVESIVYEIKRNLERKRFLALMSLSDDELRRINSNERLRLTGHPDFGIKNRSLDEDHYRKTWNHLDDLGAEYHGLVQQGHGSSTENRNARQIEIANILAERTTPYITKFVYRLIRGPGVEIYRQGQRRVVQLKGSNTPVEDLVQEGSAAVIKNLHNYDPERANLARFIDYAILTPIQRMVRGDLGVVVLPGGAAIRKARKIVDGCADRDEAIKMIMEEVKIQRKPVSVYVASTLYHGMKGGYVPIDKPAHRDRPYEKTDLFIPENALRDGSEDADAEKVLVRNFEKTKVLTALARLSPLEQKIIKERCGLSDDGDEHTLKAIGNSVGLSRERIRQLEIRALRRLREMMLETE